MGKLLSNIKYFVYVLRAKSLQSCPTLCDPSVTPWTVGASSQLLCPWDSPGKNTALGCHALFQEIFPTQGSNSCLLRLLHRQVGFLPLAPCGMPTNHQKRGERGWNWDFLGGTVDRNLPGGAGRLDTDPTPGPGRCYRTAQAAEQLSPRATTTEACRL